MILRRAVKIQLIVFLVLALVGTTYTGASYVGIGKGLFNPPFTVTAELADSGGIFKDAQVTYRGFLVGQVSELRLTENGTAVDMAIENDYLDSIPADTRALVANRSAVGEQFIDLLPQSDSGPYLEDGDVIPQEDTQIPIATAEILSAVDSLVSSVDLDALRTTIDELDKAFSGTGPTLGRLIDDGNALTNAAIENLPPTRTLIEDGVTVLQTQADSREEILSFSRQLASFSEVLRSSDPDLRRLFRTGETSTAELDALLTDLRPTLPQFLGDLDTFGQITRIRIPQLEQVLVVYPAVVAGGFTVSQDAAAQFGMQTAEEPPICQRGYEGTTRRPPEATNDVMANINAACRVPPGSDTTIRGARNAERPTCVTSGPHDTSRQTPRPAGAVTGPDPACTTAAQGSVGSRASGSVGGGATGTSAQGAVAGSGEELRGAVYDPTTGDVITSEGTVARVGTLGGQARLLGDESWKAMLLSPLAS